MVDFSTTIGRAFDLEIEPSPARALLDALEQEIVPVDVFVEDKKFLGLPSLSGPQREAVEVMTDIFPEDKTTSIIEGVVCWGKGSGKDFVARIICARIVYQLLCLRDPLSFFGMPTSDYIDTLNVALSAQQANNIFFEPYKNMIGSSPWFKNRWDARVGEIEFEKNIRSVSGHSAQEVQEGMNLMVAVMDEVAAFKTEQDILKSRNPVRAVTAANLYSVLRTSINSRFAGIGKLLLISYPRHSTDPLMTALALGEPDPRVYTTKRPTWEVHPKKKFEDFAWDFQRDPERAWSMYGCRPPQAIEAYFKMREKIYDFCKCEENKVSLALELLPEWKNWEPPIIEYDVDPNYMPVKGDELPRYVHIDLGISNDACGIAMAHPSGVQILEVPDEYEGTKEIRLPIVELDFSIQIVPTRNIEVDIARVRTIILTLVERGFMIRRVTYDQFQSRESIQFFRNLGIQCDIESVDRTTEAYDTLKTLVYGSRISGPPNLELAKQLVKLVQVKGQKVDHTDGERKDLADATVGAVKPAAKTAMTMDFDDVVRVAAPAAFDKRSSDGRRVPYRLTDRDEVLYDSVPALGMANAAPRTPYPG